MAQEEKKDGKQVVLPYDEYQEMARKIAENSFELSVKLRYEDDYPIATLKDIVSNGNTSVIFCEFVNGSEEPSV